MKKMALKSASLLFAAFLTNGPANMALTAGAAIAPNAFGNSYGEWSARWWQWLLSIPAATNPLVAQYRPLTCATGQVANVWFLAGAPSSEPVSRTCSIPLNTAIFFPIVNTIAFKPSGSETLNDLRINYAAAYINTIDPQKSFCSIKKSGSTGLGTPCADNLATLRVTSPSFTVIPPAGALIPKGNITAPRSTDPLVSDGYWAMIPPLAAGTYELKIVAKTTAGATVQDLLYTIMVP